LLVIQRLTTSILASGTPLPYNLVLKSFLLVLFGA